MLTTELRYFFDGPISERLEKIISEEKLQKEKRTDLYLKFLHADTCGLKLRDGILEIKTLVINPHLERLALSQWEKTILAMPDKSKIKGEIIPVKKSRYLKFYGSSLEALRLEDEDKLKVFCQLEISKIAVNDHVYHSFCLEANDNNSALLLDVYRYLERKMEGLEFLKTGKRMGYPQFLRTMRTD